MSDREQTPRPGVLSLIGDTPVVEITRLDTGKCRLWVKLESQNPGGSIKDRIALSMIEEAERQGRLAPGATIVEATAGNTGLGLALVAAAKGYRLILIVPDKMAREKILHLKALGAEVRITRSDVGKGHPEYYQDIAQRITGEMPGSLYVNQFENPANPKAHEETTGPEILRQMEGRIDAFVCGVGSGGTLTGVGRFLRRASPATEMVLADPEGSVLAPYLETGRLGEAGSWAVEGIGEDFIPANCDISLVSKAYAIPDQESFETARDLLTCEGILAGSSSGTLVAAALRYCREQSEPKRVATLICDSGNKYLSKMFNDFWLLEQGFVRRPSQGDLHDLVTRRHDEGGTITVGPGDTLRTAYSRMRAADVSQLPVMEDGRCIGLLDESDLLRVVIARRQDDPFGQAVESAMTRQVQTLDAGEPIDALLPLFAADRVAVVTEGDRFLGLVTRVDLINHLRLGKP
jgi:cystathionine beta-synthase